MKIENLEQAVELHSNLERLEDARKLLEDNKSPMITVYKSTSLNSDHRSVWDSEIIIGLKELIDNRIKSIKQKVESL